MTFDALLGLEVTAVSEGAAEGRVPVVDGVRQPMGLVHGGVYASIAESLATRATREALGPDAAHVRGLSTQTSFLRPVFDGVVTAKARRRHKGRTTWVWEVDVLDGQDRLCALVRATVAVTPAA